MTSVSLEVTAAVGSHTVRSDHALAMHMCWTQAVDAGYPRIGCIMTQQADASSGHEWPPRFHDLQHAHPDLPAIPMAWHDQSDHRLDQTMDWFYRHRPDCPIMRKSARPLLEGLGLEPGRDIGPCDLGVRELGHRVEGTF